MVLRLVDLQILVDFIGDLLQLFLAHAFVFLSYLVSIFPVLIKVCTQFFFEIINTLLVLGFGEKLSWHLHVYRELDLACSAVDRHGYLTDCGTRHLKEDLRVEDGLLLLLLIFNFLALNFLLMCDYFSHLLNRYCTFYINPLVENCVSISKL